VRTADFDFDLPAEFIAQHPSAARDASRLLVLDRPSNRIEHRSFRELPALLRDGDLLVLNDSKVIPARLRAANPQTNGELEILLLEENAANDWWAMMRPAKRAPVGTKLALVNLQGERSSTIATVIDTNEEGHRRLRFSGECDLNHRLDEFGELPLPPYIKREERVLPPEDHTRYQTVYAKEKGSVAAPTAGLHFTPELFAAIRARGVDVCSITLHVGLGTFAPVKAERVEEHVMHHERFHVPEDAAKKINAARREGRRVLAVGTTSVRVLETLGREHDGKIIAGPGRTNIFIKPPHHFRVVDALITNFHLPRSTLLMLVSAFAAPGEMGGREMILATYTEAIRQRYRFFSYGDAMFIT
jgi:S-adenosylmethionine:tRNA ribosyltransferase-isomerase